MVEMHQLKILVAAHESLLAGDGFNSYRAWLTTDVCSGQLELVSFDPLAQFFSYAQDDCVLIESLDSF